VPRVIGNLPADIWEREVLRHLRRMLPPDWVVVTDVGYGWKNEAGYVRDGQADFVVLVPGKGLVVLEVKGSKGIYVGEDGRWHRLDFRGQRHQLESPPPVQANNNMHNLTSKLSSIFGLNEFPGLYGWLVVYPNGDITGSIDTYFPNTVLGKKDLHKIKSAILGVLEERGSPGVGNAFTEVFVDKSAHCLVNGNFVVKPVDTELEASADEDAIETLTSQQFAALRGAFELPSVAVVGPAGSGKTLLAIWKLKALVDHGGNPCFVCFNKQLAGYLRLRYPELGEYIHHVDSLFLRLSGMKGSSEPNFFVETLPNAVMTASVSMDDGQKYDAIIVDEGQDFGDERLLALQFLLRDTGGQWLMFADAKQNLYQDVNASTYVPDVTFRLYHNCRNPSAVNESTNRVCNANVKSLPGMPPGLQPSLAVSSGAKMAQLAWTKIHELFPDGGSVILSPYRLENSCMDSLRKAYGLRLTTDLNELGKPGFVFFSTIKSFKGLEASHVVFIHAESPGVTPAIAEEDIYVVFTRATARLDVVVGSDESYEWYRNALERHLD